MGFLFCEETKKGVNRRYLFLDSKFMWTSLLFLWRNAIWRDEFESEVGGLEVTLV